MSIIATTTAPALTVIPIRIALPGSAESNAWICEHVIRSLPVHLPTPTIEPNGTGINLQLTSNYKIANHENQWVVGGGYNYGNTEFSVRGQDAVFTPSQYEIATDPLTTSVHN